jgi:N6-L-threonylcarbamoyladenine synthase
VFCWYAKVKVGMKILGIESSCDETAASVVEDGAHVLSSVVASQLETHARYGGVVPELASREHMRAIVPVVRQSLTDANVVLKQLDAIAVTSGPGLVGSLLVGVTYAKALSFATGVPLIGVNHVEGHIYAVLMEAKSKGEDIPLPSLALVVSGGHTHLFSIHEGAQGSGPVYKLIGRTRDDAAGEAYDKVAKLLGYGYPGGPVVDRLASYGNPKAIKFTTPKMKGNEFDFSFSGLKTAVLRWVEKSNISDEISVRHALDVEKRERHEAPTVEEWLAVTPAATRDLLASFQHTVVQELLNRTLASAEQINAESVIVSGGVAANEGLRAAATQSASPRFYFATRSLSTDNAAMIAATAYPKLLRNEIDDLRLKAQASLPLAI